MKLNKRVLSLIMAVVMVLSLCTVAFATDSTSTTYEKPKRSSSVDSISGISSVTVNTATAAYYRDNNTGTSDESPVYIRATVAGTDYNLAADPQLPGQLHLTGPLLAGGQAVLHHDHGVQPVGGLLG